MNGNQSVATHCHLQCSHRQWPLLFGHRHHDERKHAVCGRAVGRFGHQMFPVGSFTKERTGIRMREDLADDLVRSVTHRGVRGRSVPTTTETQQCGPGGSPLGGTPCAPVGSNARCQGAFRPLQKRTKTGPPFHLHHVGNHEDARDQRSMQGGEGRPEWGVVFTPPRKGGQTTAACVVVYQRLNKERLVADGMAPIACNVLTQPCIQRSGPLAYGPDNQWTAGAVCAAAAQANGRYSG